MKKVALMTWYTYYNYGTSLQVTALTECLRKLGYDSSIIAYEPKGGLSETHKKIGMKWLVGKVIKKIRARLTKDITYSTVERDQLFRNYLSSKLKETVKCRSYSELYDLNKEYDAFVCGSDQIWSPLCYDDKYFLSFVEYPEKMIAYAPSIGSTKIENNIIKEKMKTQISRFKYLAVREKQGADLIKELTGLDAKVVIDPTLLMSSKEWDEFADVNSVKKIKETEYIICYFLGKSKNYMRYIKKLSQELNIPYYFIPVTWKDKKSGHSVPFEVGPREFLSLIKNAKYVCTDSFHGMAFSINYNKPFSVFKRFKDNDPKNQNSRIFNLLKLMSLENRLIDYDDFSTLEKALECNFNKANENLKKLRVECLRYLESSLKQATSFKEDKQSQKKYKITDICCGCGACCTVCPTDAIAIMKDDEGFEHYYIDEEKCVRCGNCKTVCPMINIVAPQIENSKSLYAIKSKNKEVLKVSSSGGVGHEISKKLQDEDYYISGCMYDSIDKCAKHILIKPEEKNKLSLLQGSKYIQSISSNVMREISNLSKKDKLVFFGTPCQVAALDKLLKKKETRGNCILVDLICHGVPSDYLWKKYLMEMDKKFNVGKKPKVIFRDKINEWRKRLITIEGKNKISIKENQDDFYAFFRRGLCYMEACSDCPYRERSSADVRIGDYWGNRYINDKEGVSMVITNTLEGEKLVSELKNNCEIIQNELSEYWTVQYPYNPQRPTIREELIVQLKDNKKSFGQLRKEYCSYYDFKEKLSPYYQVIKKIIKKIVR